jgi:pseudouridine-5'-phosphate glycosidase
VVALETTILTHGLPPPANIECARGCEQVVRDAGALPATIGIHDGRLVVGLDDAELAELANAENVTKTNLSNLGPTLAGGGYGSTSVSTTVYAAHRSGIRVVVTGGIGGVHRGFGEHLDISSDLTALQRMPVLLVCAGAKSILDVAATREQLETRGIPVIGYRTDHFPFFYSKGRDIPVDWRLDDPESVIDAFEAHVGLGLGSAMIVAVDPPEEDALPTDALEEVIRMATEDARHHGISGRELTPFVLERVKQLTQGDSLRANLALIRNNSALGGELAVALSKRTLAND